ncbi:hypothetical protein V8F33_014219 [Rhypophila sp. PSN 637]
MDCFTWVSISALRIEHISVKDFTSTLCNDVVEVEKLLNELFSRVWQTVSKKIDIGRIVDYIIRLRAGQSFVSNPKNKRLEAGLEKVKRQHVKKWLRELRLLRETLLDKMKAIGDNGRKVARFVPDGIRRMVVAIYRMASSDQEGATAGMSAQRAGKKLARVIQTGTGVRLGVGQYQAISIEMGRRIRGLVIRQLEDKMEDEDEDNNSTHRTRITRQDYTVHIGFLGKLQSEMIATFKEISKL